MHAQIHPGQGHQYAQDDAQHPQPQLFVPPGQCTEDAHRALGMSAGEGVAGGLGPGAFHNGEVGVFHPRTGDAEPQLEELVDDRARQACSQQVIALPLINTPKEQQTKNDKEGLLTKMGDGREKRVAQRCAQPLQNV